MLNSVGCKLHAPTILSSGEISLIVWPTLFTISSVVELYTIGSPMSGSVMLNE